jgi:hypothetical protein
MSAAAQREIHVELIHQIYKDGIVITERVDDRLVKAKAILRMIAHNPVYHEKQHADLQNSLLAAVDLLEMANDDVHTLDGELGLIGQALTAKPAA